MLRTTLRSLWSHKLRLVLTMLSIVLGVAFMSGTLVLNATVGRVFDDLFAKIGQNVDAVVRGPKLFEDPNGGTRRALLDQSIVDAVRRVPGVEAADGTLVTDTVTLIDSKGDPVGGQGPPVLLGSWNVDPRMASYQIDQGRAPTRDGEVIIDRGGVRKGGFRIGSKVELIGVDGRSHVFELVGVSRFGQADSAGGSTFVGVTLDQAQRLAGEIGKINQVDVLAAPGISSEQMVDTLRNARLAPRVDVVTGAQASAEMAGDIKRGLGFFTTALLVFAFVALFVAAFIISNTFSILIAQRTRELALLRAIGASRRQVLTSSLSEAAVIGLVASIVGFGAGIGLAAGALALLHALGVDLPRTQLLVTPDAGAKVLVTGLVVTLVSAVMPAVRSTRVAPIAALRSTAVEAQGVPKLRTAIGVLTALAGTVLVLPAFGGDPKTSILPRVGAGAGLLVLALLMVGPAIARPIVKVIAAWLPRTRGVVGRLARENAVRSPRRTASTSAALTIGVALVVFITVFATSARETIDRTLGTTFNSDFIVMPVNRRAGVGADPAMARRLADVPGVAHVDARSGLIVRAKLPSGKETMAFTAAINPSTFQQVFEVHMAEGTLDQITPGTIAVDRSTARDMGLRLGQTVRLTGESGRTATFRIVALSNDPITLGQWTINRADITKLVPSATDAFVSVSLKPGTSPDAVRPALRAVVKDYRNMKLQDKEQFRSNIVGMITALLNVILGLLAVSIVIAFIGILNTMLLAIHERTRELGLLRAVGMARAQMRAAVRWEAAVVSAMGAALGTSLGLGLGYVMVRALRSQGIDQFAVPIGWIVTTAVAAVGFGIAAAAWPSFKAGKLNVLDAIATE